ncbi:hypothetical protein IMSHALPRED_003150 [Imshaugia aleurites]|uniref:Uncharacterized protein n=1 Tax=Imshaugia aleurites TaxID=172621 RepID=A0A8H3J7D9_9LECA|nr:hypothetical protein IMSHALPRED_003150 [Imshaugia aleurites]
MAIARLPKHRMRWQATCTMNVSVQSNASLESDLHMCDSTSGEVPAPGDESCNDTDRTFGIQQGFFADSRNISSSASAVAAPTKPITAVTTDAVSNTPATTDTPRTPEASCPSHTGTETGIGAGVGVPLLLALIGALAFAFHERKQLKSLKRESNKEIPDPG